MVLTPTPPGRCPTSLVLGLFQAFPVHLQMKPGCSGHASEAMPGARMPGPETDTVCAVLETHRRTPTNPQLCTQIPRDSGAVDAKTPFLTYHCGKHLNSGQPLVGKALGKVTPIWLREGKVV